MIFAVRGDSREGDEGAAVPLPLPHRMTAWEWSWDWVKCLQPISSSPCSLACSLIQPSSSPMSSVVQGIPAAPGHKGPALLWGVQSAGTARCLAAWSFMDPFTNCPLSSKQKIMRRRETLILVFTARKARCHTLRLKASWGRSWTTMEWLCPSTDLPENILSQTTVWSSIQLQSGFVILYFEYLFF